MTAYCHLREHNTWEGEAWHWYWPADEAGLALARRINAVNDSRFCMRGLVPEREVDALVAHTDSGYFDFHNKLGAVNAATLPEHIPNDTLYKGGVRAFCGAPDAPKDEPLPASPAGEVKG